MRPSTTLAALLVAFSVGVPTQADTAGQASIDLRAAEPQERLDARGEPTRLALDIEVRCGQAQAATPHYAVTMTQSVSNGTILVDFDMPQFNVSFPNQQCLAVGRLDQTVNASLSVQGEALAFQRIPLGVLATLHHEGNVVASDEFLFNVTSGFRAGLRADLVAATVTGEATVEYVFDVTNTGNAPTSVRGTPGTSRGIVSTEPMSLDFDLAYGQTARRAVNITFQDCTDPANFVTYNFSGRGEPPAEREEVASLQVRLREIPCEGRTTTAVDFIGPVGLGLLALVAVGGLVAWFLRRASK